MGDFLKILQVCAYLQHQKQFIKCIYMTGKKSISIVYVLIITLYIICEKSKKNFVTKIVSAHFLLQYYQMLFQSKYEKKLVIVYSDQIEGG